MTPGTTSRRGATARQIGDRPARRRPAAVALAAGLSALTMLVGVAAIAAAGDLGGAPSGTAAAASPSSSPSPAPTPVWRLRSFRRIGFDKTFKADLATGLAAPPELVVFGGSRAMRLAPSSLTARTGLPAFNCAVQCFRPEDAWAFSSYLYERSPDTRLRCVIALQARTFTDDQMRAGLLYDRRLARAFPDDLVARQKAALGTPEKKEVLGENRYSERGYLVRNRYDITRERSGYRFDRHIDISIERLLQNHAWNGRTRDARARAYFEKTVMLYNEHGVTPLVVLMPVQPRALRAFRAVGFQRHLDGLTAYLASAQTRCRFRVLDFTEIGSFGGSATEFYDAVHPTRENAGRIIARAVSSRRSASSRRRGRADAVGGDGAHRERASSAMAATRPAAVYSRASTATGSPRPRSSSLVIGPMEQRRAPASRSASGVPVRPVASAARLQEAGEAPGGAGRGERDVVGRLHPPRRLR